MTGCATLQHWGRVALIEAHEALDDKGAAVVSPVVTNPATVKPDVVKACSCDLSRPVCTVMEDVRQATIANPQFEECGLESSEGKPVRPVVNSGPHNLTVSSIYLAKIQTVEGGYIIPCNVEWLGYTWTPVGYSINDDHRAKMQVKFEAGKPHFVPRQFRVFLFVDGRK